MFLIKKSSFKRAFFYFSFFIILLIGFLVRIWNLDKNPAGFFCDEAAIGYNAYKILKTGGDEYGVPFPIFFRSFGDYRLPIPIYANIPFIALFGLNEFSVRLTTTVFGIISILFTILIGKELANSTVGLLTGFLLAISPWHIHLSRWGSEYISFIAFFAVGFYLVLRGSKQPVFMFFSFLVFGLTMYTYYPTLFVTPLFLGAIILLNCFKRKRWKYLLLSLFTFTIICLPLYFGYKSGVLLTRWNSINNFQQNLIIKIIRSIKSYLDHFSPELLFLKGDSGLAGHFITRHSVKGMGELYLFQLPLLIIGLFYSLFKKRTLGTILIIWLLLLYPLGSAVTDGGPLATRSIIGLIPLSFFSAVGLERLLTFIKMKKNMTILLYSYLLIGLIIIFSFGYYLFMFYKFYPLYSSDFWGWQYGPREIMRYFLSQRNNYDEFYMSGEFNAGHIFLKFYDPENLCQNKCKMGDLWGTPEIYNPAKRQLFSLSPEFLKNSKFKDKFKIKKIIYYPNGKEAFYIGEILK